jgi:F0F1-type ATP synthase assembly protein I
MKKYFSNEKENQSKEDTSWWQPGLVLVSKISSWIVGPIILSLFIGKWLDKKYQTEPWLFLLSVGIAFILSSVGIVKEAKKEIDRIEKEVEKAKSKSQNSDGKAKFESK